MTIGINFYVRNKRAKKTCDAWRDSWKIFDKSILYTIYNTTFTVCNGSKLVSVEINFCSTHVLCYHISSVFPFLWKQFPRTNQFWLGDAGKNRRSTTNPFLKFRSCTSDLHLENIRTPYSVSQKAKREKKETQNKTKNREKSTNNWPNKSRFRILVISINR